MPEVLDWQHVADPHAAVRHAAEALRAGRLVAFPTEAGYGLAASGLVPEAVARLRAGSGAGEGEPLALAVGGVAEARDWVPAMSPLAQRLARRFWPGPLTLAFGTGAEEGLAGRLPEGVRDEVCPAGALRLRTPAHEVILEVLRRLAGPVVLQPLPGVEGEAGGAASADQVLHQAGGHTDLLIDDGPSAYRRPPTVVAVNGGSWRVLQAGAISEEVLRRHSACVVVFVCTGNTCRSPLAEVLCKRRLAERLGCAVDELPARGFLVVSAGLAAQAGGPAAVEAVETARAYGADLANHRSQPLTADLAAQADYLVAMTQGHLQAVAQQFPRLGAQPRLLSPDGDDLADPIGQDQGVYEECGQQIWRHLDPLVAEVSVNQFS